jgi:hypothetical protein
MRSGPTRVARGLIEPLAFFCAVIVYIWVFLPKFPAAVVGLIVWILVSWRIHKDSPASLGLSAKAARDLALRGNVAWIALVVFAVLVTRQHLFSAMTLRSALVYFGWCLVQQVVYQSMVFRRLTESLPKTRATVLAGLLFSLVHLPNPVLVPATFVWGICASLLFSAYPSVVVLAGAQVLLSAVGVVVFPERLHHGFRIGPLY